MFDLYILETKAIRCFKIFHMKRRELRWGWSVFNQGAIGESIGSHAVTLKLSRSKWNKCSSKIQIRSLNQDNPTIPQTVCLEFLYPGLCATFVYHLCFISPDSSTISSDLLLPLLKDLAKSASDKGKAPKSFETSFVEVASMDTVVCDDTKNGQFGCCWEVLHFKYQQFFLALLGVVSLNCNKTDPPGRRPCHASWYGKWEVRWVFNTWHGIGRMDLVSRNFLCIHAHICTSKLCLPMYINVYTFVLSIYTQVYMSQTKDTCMFLFKEFDIETQPAVLSMRALFLSTQIGVPFTWSPNLIFLKAKAIFSCSPMGPMHFY